MSDVQIEIGKIYFPSLPTNHPLRKLCDEEGFDMRLQDKVCRAFTESLQDFLDGLSTQRAEEDFVEVANAREGSLRGSMVVEDEEDTAGLVGPDGRTML